MGIITVMIDAICKMRQRLGKEMVQNKGSKHDRAVKLL